MGLNVNHAFIKSKALFDIKGNNYLRVFCFRILIKFKIFFH